MRDSPSVHSQHSLNARLLRFRSQPHSEDAYALVEDLIDAGRHADARSVIGLAKPRDREDAALLLLEGRAHLLERDLIRAQAALLQAVKAEPNLESAYRYLGEVLLKRGDPLRARKTLRRALALQPDDEEARELLSRAEYLVEAANDSLEALPSAPDSEFDVDAAAEQQAAEFVDQLPSEPEQEHERPPETRSRGGRSRREDEPTSQFREGRGRRGDDAGDTAGPEQKRGITHAERPGATPMPPRQRARRQADAEPTGAAPAAPGPAGAFAPAPQRRPPAPPAAREPEWDSEPAAPHSGARAGTPLGEEAERVKRPAARRAADGGGPVPSRNAPALPSLRDAGRTGGSPRGAFFPENDEPAAPHPAARAGTGLPELGRAAAGARLKAPLPRGAAAGGGEAPRNSRQVPPPARPLSAKDLGFEDAAEELDSDEARPLRAEDLGFEAERAPRSGRDDAAAAPPHRERVPKELGRPPRAKDLGFEGEGVEELDLDEAASPLRGRESRASRAREPDARAETRDLREGRERAVPAPASRPRAGEREAPPSRFGTAKSLSTEQETRDLNEQASAPTRDRSAETGRDAAQRGSRGRQAPPPARELSAKDLGFEAEGDELAAASRGLGRQQPARDDSPGSSDRRDRGAAASRGSVSGERDQSAIRSGGANDLGVEAEGDEHRSRDELAASRGRARELPQDRQRRTRDAAPEPGAERDRALDDVGRAAASRGRSAAERDMPASRLGDSGLARDAGGRARARESVADGASASRSGARSAADSGAPRASRSSVPEPAADGGVSADWSGAEIAADGGGMRAGRSSVPPRGSEPAPDGGLSAGWSGVGADADGGGLGAGRSSVPARGSSSPPRATPPPLPGSNRPAAKAGGPGARLSDFRTLKNADAAAHAPAAAASRIAADGGETADSGPPDADQVLAVVRQLGLFEEPSGQPAAWVERRDVEPRGQRVRGTLAAIWVVTLVLCGAGYFGWTQFVERRHAAAASLVAQARSSMFIGDHGALVDAERQLRLAREQHPASQTVVEEALFVQLQRVLEDGERDTAALRSAYARAHGAHVTGASLALANLLLAAADVAGRERALAEVLAAAKGDARTLYLLGRAEERMGLETAQAHFEAAAAADAKLIPAQLALAERAYERGERAVAMRTLDAALAAAPNQLRVRLFRMLVGADDVEPDKLRQDLNGLAEPLRKGNSIDQALGALVRARLARRGAEPTAALKAIEAAAGTGVEDARVLGWLAEEALANGNSLLAQQLASRALQLAPERVRSRRLLARILVERGAGKQAFVLLSSMAQSDVEVQVWRARAALLSGEPELLRNALAALPAAVSGKKADLDVQRAALRLRIETQLDPNKAVLDRARSLAHVAPTDPDALLALAEAALALRDSKQAQSALKQRALLLPEDVQAQTLLGRSLRMGGDVDAAEAAFRRALSLRPGYVEAQTALASLLLDRGQYVQADVLYRELALREETALSGRLGRVEALLGQGKPADAQVQLEAAPEAERATAAYREVAAKLALARGEVAQALKLLGPLSAELPKRAPLRALHAEALLMAAQLSAADSELAAALALDPELPEALLGRAEQQLRANKTKDALATLDKAESALRERIRPPTLSARRQVLLGRTLLQRKKRGDADAALRALREATAQASAPADAYFFLAEAHSAAKDKTAAQEAYRRYLELAPSGAYRQRAQRMLGAAR